jgi:hypothetical protein
MNTTIKAAARPCRSVTAEEVVHFKDCGWVKLERFIDPALIAVLLERARQKMGEDADSNPREGSILRYFNPESGMGLTHPLIRPLIEQVGKNGKQLLARRSGVGVRYYEDVFIPKLPSSRKSKHGGDGITNFHQDYVSHAIDRSGGLVFWIPLEAYTPEAGTMSFVSGSHRMGVLGDYQTYGEGDAFDAYPELCDLPMSEPMFYEVGDVTVHSDMVVHGAGANLTDKPRWAYTISMKPADACWTGAPCASFDQTGMTAWKPFNERYPIIG